jgi:hypothetical protein
MKIGTKSAKPAHIPHRDYVKHTHDGVGQPQMLAQSPTTKSRDQLWPETSTWID